MKTRSEWNTAKKTAGIKTPGIREKNKPNIGPNLDRYHKALKRGQDVLGILDDLEEGYKNYQDRCKGNPKAQALLKSELIDIKLARDFEADRKKIKEDLTIDVILSSKKLSDALFKYSKSRFTEENIEYLTERKKAERISNQEEKQAKLEEIFNKYVKVGAPKEINISGPSRKKSAAETDWNSVDLEVRKLLSLNDVTELILKDASFAASIAKLLP